MIKNLMHGLAVELLYYEVFSQPQFQHSYWHTKKCCWHLCASYAFLVLFWYL